MYICIKIPWSLEKQTVISLENADIWQEDKLILAQVNFRLAPGETCYFIGKSGSGKTSLLKTIYGSLPLKNGKGMVAGFDLSRGVAQLVEQRFPKP